MRFARNYLGRYQLELEIEPRIHDERASARRSGNTAERTAVDVQSRIAEVRVIENVDCVNAHLEFFTLRDLHSLDQIHVQVQRLRTFDPSQSEIAERAGRR